MWRILVILLVCFLSFGLAERAAGKGPEAKVKAKVEAKKQEQKEECCSNEAQKCEQKRYEERRAKLVERLNKNKGLTEEKKAEILKKFDEKHARRMEKLKGQDKAEEVKAKPKK